MFKTNEDLKTDLSKIDLSCISSEWLDNLYPFQKIGIQLVTLKKKFFVLHKYIKKLLFYLDSVYLKKAVVLLLMIWAWEKLYKQ